MRALGTEWKAAMAVKGVDSRRIVSISFADAVLEFVSGSTALFGIPNAIKSVSPHSASIDLWTRSISTGERLITLKSERLVRDMVSAREMEGRRIEIQIGASNLTRDQFEFEWLGQVREVTSADGTILIRAQDIHSMLRDSDIRAEYLAMHPLSILLDIYSRCNIPTELYDYASFDYTGLTSISHWSVSRYGASSLPLTDLHAAMPDEFNAKKAVEDLHVMMNSGLYYDGEGKEVWQRYDPVGAPVRHWPAERHSGFQMKTSTRDRFDEIRVKFASDAQSLLQLPFSATSKTYVDPGNVTYAARAPSGILADHLFVGAADRPKMRSIAAPWANGIAFSFSDILAADATITIQTAERNGFCGLRFIASGSSAQNTYDAIDGSIYVIGDRRAWIQIHDEILELLQVVSVSGTEYGYNQSVTIDVLRGQLGTVAADHLQTTPSPDGTTTMDIVYDVTIPKMMTEDRRRFLYSCPTGSLRVPMTEFDILLCDKVTFDDPRVVFKGCDGADSSHVWEVIGLAVDEANSEPSIEVTLAYAYKVGDESALDVELERQP